MNKIRTLLANALNRPIFLTFELMVSIVIGIGFFVYYPSGGIESIQRIFFLWAFPISVMVLSLSWAVRAYMNTDPFGLLGLTIGCFFAIWMCIVLIYVKTGMYLYGIGSAIGVIVSVVVMLVHYQLWSSWDQRKLEKMFR